MTRAEIRRHALAIAAMRRSPRSWANSKIARARYDRGYDTAVDFVQGRAVKANRSLAYADVGAVDLVFEARARSGRLPRGCWS